MNAIHELPSTIFLVDDEPANLRLLTKILTGAGYSNLVEIADPHDVMGHYQRYRPDLILLDVRMPGMSGFEVMDQLQALNDPLMPPVLFLTVQASRENTLTALNKGARDLLSKPFDQSELLLRVRNLLEIHISQCLLQKKNTLMESMVHARTRELRESRLKIIERLGRAAEYRDDETGNHIKRMSHTAAHIARCVGWSLGDCEELLHASPMHDIGKIGIPDAILLKKGKLTPQEFTVMQSHTVIGRDILSGDDSRLMRLAAEIAFTHHEKWDGSGYPEGLSGEGIPMSGRIAAIADVFDALISKRPYKPAWPVDRVIEFLREHSGQHFDPGLVSIVERELPEILQIHSRFS